MNSLISNISGWKYRHLVKPILFRYPPDDIHELFLSVGKQLGRFRPIRWLFAAMWRYDDPMLEQTVAGLRYRNPIGLSAGFDYRADLVDVLPSLGFGFHSIGTLTLEPYAGNPPPMMQRLPKSRSLLVNKGFKNEGVAATLVKLHRAAPLGAIRGVSIGSTNKVYADFAAMVEDVVLGFQTAERCPLFDYYELNISCPNLRNLENLKEQLASPTGLAKLLTRLQTLEFRRPVFIKLPLEQSEDEMRSLLEAARPFTFIKGLIFSNLAKDRLNPAFHPEEIAQAGPGNFSGKPTQARSNALLRYAYRHYHDRFVLIGVGGVFSAEDAYMKILYGASLVQLITGMIYMGPQEIGVINAGIVALLKRDGYASVSEAIGTRA
ncbi:MAG: quinone-dependent dihydroorotate dehydrogenase [Candidatus Moraniibacteriota bacterium]